LALGCRTVQFCTLVTKYGYGVLDDICSGLSHLMAERGLSSVEQLIGAALPGPVTDFMELSPQKKLSEADHGLCLQCGNCTRCPYLAISLDERGYPATDPARCVGCSICALKCFSGAIRMRERSPEEAAALKES
jgi:dihydropyrimidine dehydrogenase (NAD+) subunit PreA